MKKTFLMTALSSVLLGTAALSAATLAQADGGGTIEFSGKLIAASCEVSSGAGVSGADGTFNVDMGSVAVANVGSQETVGAMTQVNLNVDCGAVGGEDALKTVGLRFDPQSGSGVDGSDRRLLKLSDGAQAAKGIGIAIYDDNHEILNLSGNDSIKADLSDGKASLSMRASYVKNGAEELAVGTANASLPFTLTYE